MKELNVKLEKMMENVREAQAGKTFSERMKYGRFTANRSPNSPRLALEWQERTLHYSWTGNASFQLAEVPIAILALLDSYLALFEHIQETGKAWPVPESGAPARNWTLATVVADELGVDVAEVVSAVDRIEVIPAIFGGEDLVLVDAVEAKRNLVLESADVAAMLS